ncbi:MAG: phenylacetate--CoA ligase [Dehalococcoidia bacterium]|nr:phenylacetate--CoA ligase [Dehalococcoidia bacterium]
MYWNKDAETMPRERLEAVQLQRLRETADRAYRNVPFYRQAMDARGVKPEDIRSLGDVAQLPLTTKKDFRDTYPFGLLATPMDQVVRIHASSGTTGKPVTAYYTRNDVDTWANLMARVFVAGGIVKGDLVQVAYGYGLFTGGLGAHDGAQLLGAAVVPASVGNSRRQILLIQDLGVTGLACTPSYALVIGETAREQGVDLAKSSKLRVGFFGAEPCSEPMRKEIEDCLGLKALDLYGLTEVMGPGVAHECLNQKGLHLAEDHFLVEVIDPETGHALPPGQRGELVLTTLTKEAMPVLRYRTRDIVSLYPDACPCGRSFLRMTKITGRTDDMLIIKGVNVFPSQIEDALLRVDGLEPHYQIVVDRESHLDDLEVWVEVAEDIFTDEMAQMESLELKVRAELESVLGIWTKVRLVEPGSLERSEGKAKRVIDRRDLGLKGGR